MPIMRSKIRYINKQRAAMSCCGVALVNTLKWLGEDYTSSLISELQAGGWLEKDGMTKIMFEGLLKIYQVPHFFRKPTDKNIDNALRSGRMVICFQDLGDYGMHVFVVLEKVGNIYKTLNGPENCESLQNMLRDNIIVVKGD